MRLVSAGRSDQQPEGRYLALKRAVFILIPTLFVGALAVGVLRSDPGVRIGGPAPEFNLPLVGADSDSLSTDDLKGKVAVVNFFSSWCASCKIEAPVFERTWQQYREKGLVVLGINIQDVEEDALDFIARYRITHPVVRDANQEVANQFGVKGIPETFFIDHRWTFAGIGTQDQIGTRGKTVIYGAISSAVLKSQVELLISRMPRGI